MKYQRHSIEFDDSPPLKFLVGKKWWTLTALYTDEQKQVRQLEGKREEERRTFDSLQVRDASEIFDKVCALEVSLREGMDGNDLFFYGSGFADGHKRNCTMASPVLRSKIIDSREGLKKEFDKEKLGGEAVDIETKLRAALCTCDSLTKD